MTGSARVATYESVLETITYNDTAASPNTTTRNIQFTVTDANNLKSNVAVATVSFPGTYTETARTGEHASTERDTANPTIIIDPDDVVNAPTVTSATVTISSGFVSSAEDVLALSNQFQQNFHITLSQPVRGRNRAHRQRHDHPDPVPGGTGNNYLYGHQPQLRPVGPAKDLYLYDLRWFDVQYVGHQGLQHHAGRH